MSKRGNAQNAAKCKAYEARGQREKNKERRNARIQHGLHRAADGHIILAGGKRVTPGQLKRILRRHPNFEAYAGGHVYP